jgi:hypothetical protein
MMTIEYTDKSYLYGVGTFKKFYLDSTILPALTNSTGTNVVVPPECENRPDLFSYQQYGSSRLWWIIALANADILKDPVWDLKSGMTLFVPNKDLILVKLAEVR